MRTRIESSGKIWERAGEEIDYPAAIDPHKEWVKGRVKELAGRGWKIVTRLTVEAGEAQVHSDGVRFAPFTVFVVMDDKEGDIV
jgi:hypothetical protein